MCPQNQYMAGVESYHNNGKEDRRWRITCCGSTGFKTKECTMTGYINSFRAYINYPACKQSSRFMAGFYSYHDNKQE